MGSGDVTGRPGWAIFDIARFGGRRARSSGSLRADLAVRIDDGYRMTDRVPLPRPLLRLARVCLLALSVTGCAIPGPRASDAAIASIPRDSVAVHTTAFDGRVSYLHAGTPRRARVVLVHGTPGSARGWADFLLHVPPGEEYIAPDRPGFGHSDPAGAVVSLKAQAQALAPFLDPPGGAPVILVGHSLGAGVIAEAATLYPDRIDGLVFVAGALDPAQEDPDWIHWLQSIGTVPPFSWLLPRDMDDANRELIAYEAQLRALEPHLRAIHQPVRILHGTADGLVPFANVAYMRRMFSDASVSVTRIPGGSHFLPWTRFPLVQSRIQGLVQTLSDAAQKTGGTPMAGAPASQTN